MLSSRTLSKTLSSTLWSCVSWTTTVAALSLKMAPAQQRMVPRSSTPIGARVVQLQHGNGPVVQEGEPFSSAGVTSVTHSASFGPAASASGFLPPSARPEGTSTHGTPTSYLHRVDVSPPAVSPPRQLSITGNSAPSSAPTSSNNVMRTSSIGDRLASVQRVDPEDRRMALQKCVCGTAHGACELTAASFWLTAAAVSRILECPFIPFLESLKEKLGLPFLKEYLKSCHHYIASYPDAEPALRDILELSNLQPPFNADATNAGGLQQEEQEMIDIFINSLDRHFVHPTEKLRNEFVEQYPNLRFCCTGEDQDHFKLKATACCSVATQLYVCGVVCGTQIGLSTCLACAGHTAKCLAEMETLARQD
ncbi:unnamed protein product [Amoebophrya sp. A25]|nr:unnamed protein product [Amoebophrya sp. A25]|eukprot:GSA25T00004726001.1